MRIQYRLAGCGLALVLTACGGAPSTQVPAEGDAPAADPATSVPESGPAEATSILPVAPHAGEGLRDKQGNPIALVPFDISTVPMSSATLGELPFFSLPDGYGPINRPNVRAFSRFPFRMGDGLHWVEGASWDASIGIAREERRDKEFS